MIDILSNPTYFIPPLVAGVVMLVLLTIALIWSKRDLTTGLFAGLLASIALRNFMVFALRFSPTEAVALNWERAIFPLVFIGYLLFYHFTLVYTSTKKQTWLLRFGYLLLIIIIALAPTDLLVKEMRIEDYGYAPIVGLASYIGVPAGPLFIIVGAYNLLKHYRISTSGNERKRLVILMIAALVPLVSMVLDGFTNLPPMSIWTDLIFVILCTIAIVRYQLLDIQIVIRKSLVYILVSVVAAIPFVAILFIASYAFGSTAIRWWLYIILLIVLAIILRPLYGWAQNLVDKWFYQERYDFLRALEKFSRETQSISDINELSSKLMELLSGALRITSGCHLLRSDDDSGFVEISCIESRAPSGEIVLKKDSLLVRWLETYGDIVTSKEFSVIPQLQNLPLMEKENLERMNIKIYVPIRTNEGILSGILALGDKLIQRAYTDEDRRLLSTVARQMAITLENARLYHSEKSMREELQQIDEQKTEFLHNVAHELKTPLTAILSSSEIMNEELPLDDKVRGRLIGNISRSAQILDRRVADLLDLARVQIGGLKIVPKPLEIGTVITDIASQVMILFENKQQKLNLEIPESLPRVNADKDKLQQILFNLLSNANKYSPVDSEILLRAKTADGYIIVEVKDSAPVISSKDGERIFDPYYRGEDSRQKQELPGLGLGLAISKKLVELHQGEIWVESKAGNGNIFAFSIPVLNDETE